MRTNDISTPGAPTAAEILARTHDLVDPVLRAAVADMSPPIARIVGYHFGWCDETGRPRTGHGGKAIRPALALSCAEAVGGVAADAVPAAVAVELVHNFSLVHDDVMDGDRVRRHRPTVWSVFGVREAILVGDALLALASRVLADGLGPAGAEAVRRLNACVLELCEGQRADLGFEHRDDVTLTECLAMARGKTGALLGCSCALGALCGGAGERQTGLLAEFGRGLGLAFQLVDDTLGIWGDPAVTGKPVHSDLRGRKKSLPVVAALTSATTAGTELAGFYLGDRLLDEDDLGRAVALIDQAHARTWTERATADAFDQAITQLTAALPDPATTARLLALAQLITRRDH